MAKFEYMERAFSSELRPRARLVLQVLVLHCNKGGRVFSVHQDHSRQVRLWHIHGQAGTR